MSSPTIEDCHSVRDSDCVPRGVNATRLASPQGDLCWPDPDRYRKQWEQVLEVLQEIVALVSLKEAAFVIGVSDKALGHALAERERHYPRMDWLPAVAALARSCGFAERLGAILVAPLGLSVCSPQISDAEWRRRVELSLARTGPVGAAVLVDAGVAR